MGSGGKGPAAYDLIYGGSTTKWTEAAHTLKARIYLHQEEKLGAAQYTSALNEAKKGISTSANDWLTVHSSATSERNLWAQFQLTSFGQDLVAGSVLAKIMVAQNDKRLPDYFAKNSHGVYGGYDVSTQTTPADSISSVLGSSRTNDPEFSQPIITYDETQLIIAEAAFQTNDKATATTALNNVRARYSKAPIANPTLTDIMTEKYILTFQNVEAWNDYKRTCTPGAQAGAQQAGDTRPIPVRIDRDADEHQRARVASRRSPPVATGTTRTAVRKSIGAGKRVEVLALKRGGRACLALPVISCRSEVG